MILKETMIAFWLLCSSYQAKGYLNASVDLVQEDVEDLTEVFEKKALVMENVLIAAIFDVIFFAILTASNSSVLSVGLFLSRVQA